MYLRNNSEKEWLQYDCGTEIVDVPALSDFKVSESAAKVLLRNLGCAAWVTRIEGDIIQKEEVEEKKVEEVIKEVKKEKAPKKNKKNKK